ncbi:hypothetical protein UFOVP723_127 [uncultured Caudovirales phage]|jgi:hypothetical protein|uniref:Uncharacterized protein n=1 Tax=uncultured Caudovirales phage TaxID=2100421 RepID=A0A6J5NT65_9CAUD|nr:hypothetical protein UFOVP723_127 [uncultured Caudovirales phage]
MEKMALKGMTAVAIGLSGIVLYAMIYAVIQASTGGAHASYTAVF